MTSKFPEIKHQERVVKTPTSDTLMYVKLQSTLDARVSYTGQVTGKSYEWNRAGSVVPVDARDAPALLEKRIRRKAAVMGAITQYLKFLISAIARH